MSAHVPRRVALTGFGSVGRSFAEILAEDPELPTIITAVADRGGYALNPNGLNPSELLAAKRSGSVANHGAGSAGTLTDALLQQSQADVLLELASTNYEDGEPGWSYSRAALGLGMDVVLASKGPLVAHWDELFALASERGRQVRYSATHGAPLPLIDLARIGLTGSKLRSVRALFNSTTGLLLELMETGKSLPESVAVVAAAGVAETNPSLDIEGWDAAAKCVIVGRGLFGGSLTLDGVQRKGIEDLTAAEAMEAAESGTPMKLLCTIESASGELSATVAPARLQPDDPLSHLRNGALGIVYDAEPVGPMFLATYGAGGRPTAAAVLRDVLNLPS